MSYSFTVRGITAAAALAPAAAQMDEVVRQQPPHKVDRDAALANAQAHLDLLAQPTEDQEIVLSMNGSIGGDLDWNTGDVQRLTSAGSACSAYITART